MNHLEEIKTFHDQASNELSSHRSRLITDGIWTVDMEHRYKAFLADAKRMLEAAQRASTLLDEFHWERVYQNECASHCG